MMFIMMISQWSFAQQNITGTVSDDAGVPIPGATVLVTGTNNGVSTDFDGNYSIIASEGDILSFSYVGYLAQEISVDSASMGGFYSASMNVCPGWGFGSIYIWYSTYLITSLVSYVKERIG